MNRRHFMATIGGVVAGAVEAKCGLLQSMPSRTGPDYSKEYTRDFDAKPVSYGIPYWRDPRMKPPEGRNPPRMLLCCDGNLYPVHECDHTGRIIPDTPVADMLEANRRITIRGGSKITPRIKGIQA